MSNRTPCSTVFVGNIFYEVTEDMLVKLLSEVGPVKSLRLVCDRETGKPKGFGFCEFFDVHTAESAPHTPANATHAHAMHDQQEEEEALRRPVWFCRSLPHHRI